jgi:cytochrome c55X
MHLVEFALAPRKNGNMNCASDGPDRSGKRMTLPVWHARPSLTAIAARALVLAIAWNPLTFSLAADAAPSSPDAARRSELITLVRQDCGSCHGLTLKGGLGPALLPETLADKAPLGLKATILYGRPGTAMPPWNRFVTEAEAEWIVTSLQKGFPGER